MSSAPTTLSHYIYDTPDSERLCQGDLLARTGELLGVLEEYHRYYATHESYEYFMVLTQSCDLVRRGKKPPNAPYITIAAVRPVAEALYREAQNYQEWWQVEQNVITDGDFDSLALFVRSLLDNNQPNYFYLHRDDTLGISESYCAFLNLSVSIKTKHYNDCLKAKRAQLGEPFQAKLGWLVGNLYSRVGTQEWDSHYGANHCARSASEILKGAFRRVSSKKIKQAIHSLTKQQALDEYTSQEILDRVEAESVASPAKSLERNVRAAVEAFNLPQRVASTLESRLSKDGRLAQSIQDSLKCSDEDPAIRASTLERNVRELVTQVCSEEEKRTWDRLTTKLIQKIVQDETVKKLIVG
jgi:hypothetical protein